MLATLPRETLDAFAASFTMKRLGHPDEIARAVAFLSDDGAYVSGAIVPVGAGWRTAG